MRRLIMMAVILLLAGLSFAQQGTQRFESVAGRMVQAINKGDYEAVGAHFHQSMEEFFPLEKRIPFFAGMATQYGRIKKLGPARLKPSGEAVLVADCERGMLDIKLWLDGEDKIVGLFFLPHEADIPVPEKHETKLLLPLKGRWLVVWGGDTKELNIHHDHANQKFAFDFLGVDEQGNTHRGDTTRNEGYLAFGREVLAPADGVVTEVIDGVRDNVPGSMNPYSALGNAVFIQHAEHEVSVLAHLKQGSITVKAGDKVEKGQVIGLCGNSGNSSEPHLHYHLQNTPIIQDGAGIKCIFEKVTLFDDAKKQAKANYSPVKGDIIAAE